MGRGRRCKELHSFYPTVQPRSIGIRRPCLPRQDFSMKLADHLSAIFSILLLMQYLPDILHISPSVISIDFSKSRDAGEEGCVILP